MRNLHVFSLKLRLRANTLTNSSQQSGIKTVLDHDADAGPAQVSRESNIRPAALVPVIGRMRCSDDDHAHTYTSLIGRDPRPAAVEEIL